MSLLMGRAVLFLLMTSSYFFLAIRGGKEAPSSRWRSIAGAILLGATFAWAFYLGSLTVLSQAVIRI